MYLWHLGLRFHFLHVRISNFSRLLLFDITTDRKKADPLYFTCLYVCQTWSFLLTIIF